MAEIAQALDILHALGEHPPEPPQRIAGGRSGTGIWRFRSGERGWRALRVFAPDEAGVAARETAVMVHAGALGFPVPEVHASRAVLGRPVMVLEWIDGQSLERALLPRPWQGGDLGRRAGKLMARLHRTGAPTGLALARDWPNAAAFPASLRERLRDSAIRTDALVHLDFHPMNLIQADDGREILIDWTNARAGDPRFDFARTLVLFAILPGMTPLERAVVRRLFGSFARGWRAAYLEESGPPADMPVFLSWASYGMLAEWRFKRRRAGEEPDVDEEWALRLRGLVARWMREARLDPGAEH